ncbi:MauE/DoxX family redox-associated membrane protein [Nocardia sp. NPDC020380]|uniref:MauE/DoxX family redox-associated membrane protein n=1 Tax=Nocardia sp. NPDC020380 TaxID=3364309 RepID=UPI0037B45C8A
MWWEPAAWAVRMVFGAVFAVAAYGKFTARDATGEALAAFGVPMRLTPAAVWALPAVEAVVAAALLVPYGCVASAVAGVLLLAGFTAAVGWRLRRGDRPACACFGEPSATPIGMRTLVRNLGLLVLGGVAVAATLRYPDLPATGISGDRLLIISVAVALAAVQVRQGLMLHAFRSRAGDSSTMALQLEIGSRAPDFELPSTTGVTSLRQLLTSGRSQMLIFLHPGCGPCKSIAGDLPALSAGIREYVDVVVIGSGTLAENALWRDEYGIGDYLVQQRNEIARRYAISGTPTAIQVGPSGKIESAPAPGAGGIRGLFRENPSIPERAAAKASNRS